MRNQKAGAYHLDLGQNLGGQPVVVSYPDFFESAQGARVTVFLRRLTLY